MMKTPSEFELNQLMHLYDPTYAHQYYLRTRNLKGRTKGSPKNSSRSGSGRDPRTGKKMPEIHRNAKEKQKQELQTQIHNLEQKLVKLDAMIKKLEHEAASENRASKAKKERAAKESTKPDTAAEKAEKARDSKQYRDKHKQELATKAKSTSSSNSSSGSSSSTSESSTPSVKGLKTLATKVRGQIAVAKQKLAAL